LIRTLHFSDFLKLGRLHEAEVGLNLPDSLVVPNSPLSAALIQRLPVQSLSSFVYICEEAGKPVAFVQANAARRRNEEWNVLALGVVDNSSRSKNSETSRNEENGSEADSAASETAETTSPTVFGEDDEQTPGSPSHSVEGREEEREEPETAVAIEDQPVEKLNPAQLVDDTEMAWLKLLEYLVMDAGEKGVVRVYAKLSTESQELTLFNQTGFHSYTQESLSTLHYESPVERPASLKVRPQRGRDAWFINELYRAITPSFVQNTEQYLSRDWEIHRGYFPRPAKEYGWVLEEGEKVVAYVRIMSNRTKHMLRIMNLDTRRELLPDLVRFALSTLKDGPECYVYCTVREYQAEQEAVVEDAGFTYFGKQAVMVTHTVQFIRSTERALAHARDRKLELAHSARPNLLVRLLAKLPFHYTNPNNY
jgi:hypothetical protein